MTLAGGVMTRTSAIYALASGIAVPIGLLSIAVTTRYLDPGEFGRLASLFAMASIVTIIVNLASLQGTLVWVFGSGGEDGDEDGAGEIADTEETPGTDRKSGRVIMASGMSLTLLVGGVFGGLLGAFANTVDAVLFRFDDVEGVRLAIICGVTGAVWRLVHQVFRLERRPVPYAIVSTTRPLLVVAFSVYALAQGAAVHGVLFATALGNVVASLVAFGLTYRNYSFPPRLRHFPEIYRRGIRFIPLQMLMLTRNNADVLILSQVAKPSDVGFYVLATRIGQIPVYVTSAFLTAWPPLERSPIFREVIRRRGHSSYAGTLYTYLMTLSVLLALWISLGAAGAVRIASPSYAQAADLVPFTCLAFTAHTAFYGLFRATRFPHRRWYYVGLGTLAIVLSAPISAVLIPHFGSYALAVATAATALAGAFGMRYFDRRAGDPIELKVIRLTVPVVTAAAIVTLTNYVLPEGAPRFAAQLAACGGFPFLLVALGIVPKTRLRSLAEVSAHALPWYLSRRRAAARWSELPRHEREAVVAMLAHQDTKVAAQDLQLSETVMLARLTRGLRRLRGSYAQTPQDHLIGVYLTTKAPTVERDHEAARLHNLGADMLDLHRLDQQWVSLRRFSRRGVARRLS